MITVKSITLLVKGRRSVPCAHVCINPCRCWSRGGKHSSHRTSETSCMHFSLNPVATFTASHDPLEYVRGLFITPPPNHHQSSTWFKINNSNSKEKVRVCVFNYNQTNISISTSLLCVCVCAQGGQSSYSDWLGKIIDNLQIMWQPCIWKFFPHHLRMTNTHHTQQRILSCVSTYSSKYRSHFNHHHDSNWSNHAKSNQNRLILGPLSFPSPPPPAPPQPRHSRVLYRYV